ncbi:MAG: glutathione S-transferase [Kofleriaceae bacterium]|nr:glutathione S-transferase [Kofleriaceae bacterium]
MLTVHHLNNSRSQRVLWLLEELGVPYEIVKYERDPKTMLAPPELQKIHPLGKSPVVTDEGQTLAESAAILEYIVEKYGNGRLVPAKGTPEYTKCRYYMHYAEGSLMPLLLVKLLMSRVRKAPALVRPIAKAIAGKLDGTFTNPNLTRHVGFLAGELAKSPYFAGSELTVADIQMSFPMEAIAARVPDVPNPISAFVERIHERPAFKKALERGGPYDVMS